MKVDVIASERHFLDHMQPIYEALPEHMRGIVYHTQQPVKPPVHRNRVAMVAGWQDVQPLRGLCRMIYVEHGAGQTYQGDPRTAHFPGYSGSGGGRHGGVIGFIAPNQTVADRWKTAPAIAVGCPKMAEYHHRPAPTKPPAVCVTFHWPCELGPELGTALGHYKKALPEVVERWKTQGFKVYGHAHPRWDPAIYTVMEGWGMTPLRTDREVFARAHVLILDNSSLGMEFMSLGRPVVWLNAPQYRRDIHHRGRFWDWTLGVPTVDEPEQLLTLNLWDVVGWQVPGVVDAKAAQQRHVDDVYAFNDGTQAVRAADFIAEILASE